MQSSYSDKVDKEKMKRAYDEITQDSNRKLTTTHRVNGKPVYFVKTTDLGLEN